MQDQLLSSICVRAPRYTPAGAVDYRDRPDGEWAHGRLVNVSRTGALFTALSATSEGAIVEFVLRLAIPGVDGEARIHCLGRVMRCREGPGAQWSVATRFVEYEFLHTAWDDDGASAEGMSDWDDRWHFEETNDGKK